MRALCGAIITAGALLSLGLISIGMGYRYAAFPYLDPQSTEKTVQKVALHNTDTGLLVAFIAALCCVAIGLGIAFVGLAYHHHRRHLEMLHRHGTPASPTPPPGPSERITV